MEKETIKALAETTARATAAALVGNASQSKADIEQKLKRRFPQIKSVKIDSSGFAKFATAEKNKAMPDGLFWVTGDMMRAADIIFDNSGKPTIF